MQEPVNPWKKIEPIGVVSFNDIQKEQEREKEMISDCKKLPSASDTCPKPPRQPFSWHTRAQLHATVGSATAEIESKPSPPPVPSSKKPLTPPPLDLAKGRDSQVASVVELPAARADPGTPAESAAKAATDQLLLLHRHTIDVPMEIAKVKANRSERLKRLDELKQFQDLQNVNLKLISLRQEQAIMRLSKQHQLLLLGGSANSVAL